MSLEVDHLRAASRTVWAGTMTQLLKALGLDGDAVKAGADAS